MGFHAVEDIL
jgi:hypothetical protein